MYLKSKWITFYKVKNAILSILGFFEIATSIFVLSSLVATYSEQLEVVLQARAFPECVVSIIIGIICFLIVLLSRKMIGDAYFYSGYFEQNLTGHITFEELELVTGKAAFWISLEIPFLRFFYMKKFELKTQNGKYQIVLYSKRVTCECKSCGAVIEKSTYFAGQCKFCDSSDLFARVLTEDCFYSISSEFKENRSKKKIYENGNLETKRSGFLVCMTVFLIVLVINIIMLLDSMAKYNDMDYLREKLFAGGGSYALIRGDLADLMIWAVVWGIVFAIGICILMARNDSVGVARNCAVFFAEKKKPFVAIDEMAKPLVSSERKRIVGRMQKAIRRGYLRNCTFEVHDDVLKIALQKKITKDRCPTCNGAIVGAVDEKYQCKYCGNLIMDVVQKK